MLTGGRVIRPPTTRKERIPPVGFDRIANIGAAIVGVAMVTTLVSSPNTARIVAAIGNTFAGSLRAAMGR